MKKHSLYTHLYAHTHTQTHVLFSLCIYVYIYIYIYMLSAPPPMIYLLHSISFCVLSEFHSVLIRCRVCLIKALSGMIALVLSRLTWLTAVAKVFSKRCQCILKQACEFWVTPLQRTRGSKSQQRQQNLMDNAHKQRNSVFFSVVARVRRKSKTTHSFVLAGYCKTTNRGKTKRTQTPRKRRVAQTLLLGVFLSFCLSLRFPSGFCLALFNIWPSKTQTHLELFFVRVNAKQPRPTDGKPDETKTARENQQKAKFG